MFDDIRDFVSCNSQGSPVIPARRGSRPLTLTSRPVECFSFSVSQFVSILGPVEETLSLGVQNGFGLRRIMSAMPGEMKMNSKASFRGRRRMSVECQETGKERDLNKDDFEEVAFLGKGGYGRVVLAKCICKQSSDYGKQVCRRVSVRLNRTSAVSSARTCLLSPV